MSHHALINRLQTLLLIAVLLAIAAGAGWLLPGWGNPEPSWLRTHPATEERIARLMTMEENAAPAWDAGQWYWPYTAPRRAPRWRVGGIWH